MCKNKTLVSQKKFLPMVQTCCAVSQEQNTAYTVAVRIAVVLNVTCITHAQNIQYNSFART